MTAPEQAPLVLRWRWIVGAAATFTMGWLAVVSVIERQWWSVAIAAACVAATANSTRKAYAYRKAAS